MGLSDNMKGALLMALAMTAFTVNDVFMKQLSGHLPLFQAIFLRGCLTSLLIGGLAWRAGALRLPRDRRDRGLVGLRCAAEAGAAYFFLSALFNMPIGQLTAILQALPLAVTLGAALAFGEPVGWRRWSAIGIGFVGVLLIVQPWGEAFTIFAVYGVATVVCAAVRDLATRRLSASVPSLGVTFVTAVTVALFALAMSAGEDWVRPDGYAIWRLVAAAGLIFIAYQTIIMAMRVGEIGFVAPFRYTGLVAALVAGAVVFGERPAPLTLLGAAIVVATGLFTLHRERMLRRQARVAAAR